MDSKIILRYRLGIEEWKEFPILKNEIIIGRGEDCDLVLDHREVSRQHARISQVSGQILITDLGSSNGTIVEGQTLTPNRPVPLDPGSTVLMGRSSIFSC